MKLRRMLTPTVLALLLVVGLLAAPAFAQDPDAHVPAPDVEAEVDVRGVVIEREPAPDPGEPVGVEVLGVTIEDRALAVTGSDTLLLVAIGVGLIGLGIVAFGLGRRRSASEGSGTGH